MVDKASLQELDITPDNQSTQYLIYNSQVKFELQAVQ